MLSVKKKVTGEQNNLKQNRFKKTAGEEICLSRLPYFVQTVHTFMYKEKDI